MKQGFWVNRDDGTRDEELSENEIDSSLEDIIEYTKQTVDPVANYRNLFNTVSP